jgi:hypothetical protein
MKRIVLSITAAAALAVAAYVVPQKPVASFDDPPPNCFPWDCSSPNGGGGGNRAK